MPLVVEVAVEEHLNVLWSMGLEEVGVGLEHLNLVLVVEAEAEVER